MTGLTNLPNHQVVGGLETLRAKLEHLVDQFQVDELMFTNDLYDQQKRLNALDILASISRSAVRGGSSE